MYIFHQIREDSFQQFFKTFSSVPKILSALWGVQWYKCKIAWCCHTNLLKPIHVFLNTFSLFFTLKNFYWSIFKFAGFSSVVSIWYWIQSILFSFFLILYFSVLNFHFLLFFGFYISADSSVFSFISKVGSH